jgi:hypothetical protein
MLLLEIRCQIQNLNDPLILEPADFETNLKSSFTELINGKEYQTKLPFSAPTERVSGHNDYQTEESQMLQ